MKLIVHLAEFQLTPLIFSYLSIKKSLPHGTLYTFHIFLFLRVSYLQPLHDENPPHPSPTFSRSIMKTLNQYSFHLNLNPLYQ
ncbi:hypothetical protein HanRHA438_Chr16g0756371 [Helianthus annuus]|uniref:Uncharacterized protein n=1 Tax=Helianthus annuus TaxID=4232 RepID=A0A251RXC8_HELAN|nr:hypothetical protein HanXRQr2_Chr16g0744601 [Helianthus annuus]KAJ0681342.1 hypothetical protein HanPI659440_Chr16g0634731 [Helianthus annuus]KAJ0820926.1 hypothetical protein HanPSC8_Chr16g0713891 [Helianthus annuus]KAJ0835531.1 hypothetical protein HanRHA438_Chr16g0756371 [Helianthus annuus]